MSGNQTRTLLLALPLPLAQAWRRTLYSTTHTAVHERTVFVLEAVLKYLASATAAVWAAQGARGEAVQKACEALVRPSLGQWAAIFRACLAALPGHDPVCQWTGSVLERSVSSRVPGLAGRNVGMILESLPSYRNQLAHGSGLNAEVLAERAPGIHDLAREILASLLNEAAPELFGRAGRRTVRLMGPTALPAEEASDSLPADLVLRTNGRLVPLQPLWIFDPEEDDVLVLNKGAGLKKVEYLSYGITRGSTGLTVQKGNVADLAARFLTTATGRSSLEAVEVAAMVEETEVRELMVRATEQWIGPYRVVRRLYSLT